jgi:hypothetical protein
MVLVVQEREAQERQHREALQGLLSRVQPRAPKPATATGVTVSRPPSTGASQAAVDVESCPLGLWGARIGRGMVETTLMETRTLFSLPSVRAPPLWRVPLATRV